MELSREKLWDEVGTICDCCGGSIMRDRWDRPWSRKALSRAGYCQAVCRDCDEKYGELLDRFFLRVIVRASPAHSKNDQQAAALPLATQTGPLGQDAV